MKAEFFVSVTDAMMQMFLEMSGDDNPLHLDSAYAAEQGFSAPVVYGLLTTSFYSRLVGVHLPGKHMMMHAVSVEFCKPVFVGDKLKVSGEIKHLQEAYKQVELKVRIYRENAVVSRGLIKVGMLL